MATVREDAQVPDARARILTAERHLLFLDPVDMQARRSLVQTACRALKHRDGPVAQPGTAHTWPGSHRAAGHLAGGFVRRDGTTPCRRDIPIEVRPTREIILGGEGDDSSTQRGGRTAA